MPSRLSGRWLCLAALAMGCGAADASSADDTAEVPLTPVPEDAERLRWRLVLERAGVTPNREGRATVIGVRGLAIDGTRHEPRSAPAFDDVLVVFPPGRPIVKLAVSTHPFQKAGVSGVPDVDRDGTRDVGMIRPGFYVATGRGPARLTGGRPAFEIGTRDGAGRIPGVRDTNHDGVFDGAEDAASVGRRDGLTDVLFHHAGGGAPPAVGCQVLGDADMATLAALVGGASATFDYLLVDAASL